MESKFNFFERVKIVGKDFKNKQKNKFFNSFGTVLAFGLEYDGIYGYDVSLDKDNGYVWGFREDELESLGIFIKPEDHFVGESIKVGVTKDGKGYIKD